MLSIIANSCSICKVSSVSLLLDIVEITSYSQFLNRIGIYFVLSMSVHNLRIKQAWDEKEKELTAMKEQFTKIESKLSSSEWAEEVVKQVKASTTATETLQTQVKTAFDEAKITGYTDPVVPKSAKDTITTAFEQLVSSGNKKSEEGTNAGNATKMI